MRVIIAGFGPFPGAPFNPSALLAETLTRRRRPALAGIERTSHIFATTYASVDRDLPKLLARKPDIVLLFGLAARRRHLCIETRARNAVSPLFPDAEGFRPSGRSAMRGGPSAVSGQAPFARLLGAVREHKFPARLSRDAGRYLCNYAYWQALRRAQHGNPLVVFIHVPSVRMAPQRPRRRPKPAFAQLAVAAEALLIALVAASRR